LVRGQEIALVLDGAGTTEDLPVRRAGRRRERGRHEQHLGAVARESAVELREAQVVADRAAERRERGTRHHRLRPGETRRRFLHRHAAGQGDVEEMDLPVARDDRAGGVDHAARVMATRIARNRFEQRSHAQHDAELAREGRHRSGRGARNRLGGARIAGVDPAPGEDLGQHDETRAAARGLAHEHGRPSHVRVAVRARGHLRDGCDEALHRCSAIAGAHRGVNAVVDRPCDQW
jgi:hypothetical protein